MYTANTVLSIKEYTPFENFFFYALLSEHRKNYFITNIIRIGK